MGGTAPTQNPFQLWITRNEIGDYSGGVFHVETGDVVAIVREPWASAVWLEETLERIAQQQWVHWLSAARQPVPAWLAMKTAIFSRSWMAQRRRARAVA